jgi:hypothetical protein
MIPASPCQTRRKEYAVGAPTSKASFQAPTAATPGTPVQTPVRAADRLGCGRQQLDPAGFGRLWPWAFGVRAAEGGSTASMSRRCGRPLGGGPGRAAATSLSLFRRPDRDLGIDEAATASVQRTSCTLEWLARGGARNGHGDGAQGYPERRAPARTDVGTRLPRRRSDVWAIPDATKHGCLGRIDRIVAIKC